MDVQLITIFAVAVLTGLLGTGHLLAAGGEFLETPRLQIEMLVRVAAACLLVVSAFGLYALRRWAVIAAIVGYSAILVTDTQIVASRRAHGLLWVDLAVATVCLALLSRPSVRAALRPRRSASS